MKVMILAAGRGQRMGALTQSCPKPLIKVAGKPLLQHHLERLQAAGYSDVVINVAYLGEQIQQFIHQDFLPSVAGAMNIEISVESHCLETGGGIHNALPLLGDQPFAVINGDVWTDYPLQQLPATLNGLAHLVLVDNPEHNQGGDFTLEGSGQALNQPGTEAGTALTFSGVSVLSPLLFRGCQSGVFPLAPLLRRAADHGQLTAEHYQGIWTDVGTPARLQAVENSIQEQ